MCLRAATSRRNMCDTFAADQGMKADDSQIPQGLRALCRQAGKQAAGWHAGTGGGAKPAPMATPPGRLRRQPLLKIALVGGSSLLALAVLAAQLRSATPPVGTPALVSTAAAPQAAPLALPAQDAAGLIEPVRWQGSELLIDIDELPLPQAVDLLARATRTTVTGTELLRKPVPVTLHARFSDAKAAWQQLLQSRAGFSISCGASACQIWIGGEIAAPAVAATPGAERTAPAAAATPEDKAREELEISQPGGSC
jgi:hypothetical protein